MIPMNLPLPFLTLVLFLPTYLWELERVDGSGTGLVHECAATCSGGGLTFYSSSGGGGGGGVQEVCVWLLTV